MEPVGMKMETVPPAELRASPAASPAIAQAAKFVHALGWLTIGRTAFFAIFLLGWCFLRISDYDYFWHIKAGEYIFTQRALPDGDIFSYTFAGRPWVLHEWLFEIVLYVVYRYFGEVGVTLLTSGIVTLTLAVFHDTAKRLSGSSTAAFGLTLLIFVPFLIGAAPRPQIVTYFFLTVFLRILLGVKYQGRLRATYALPCIMVVWANVHGGYVIGIAALATFTFSEWCVFFMNGRRDTEGRHRNVALSVAVATTLIASLANPNFLAHWLYPFEVMSMKSNRYISEWASPNFHGLSGQSYLVVCATFALCFIYSKRKPDLTELFLPACFGLAGFISMRHIPPAALAIGMFTAVAFRNFDASPERANGSILQKCGKLYRRWISGGKQLGGTECLLNATVLVVLGATLAVKYPIYHSADSEMLNRQLPVKAVDFVISHHITGRVFNEYGEGGYLIYRLYPHAKVFIDGRADMYGEDFVQQYLDIRNGGADWKQKLSQYHIDYMIIPIDAPIRQLLLESGDFTEPYADNLHAVLVRRSLNVAGISAATRSPRDSEVELGASVKRQEN